MNNQFLRSNNNIKKINISIFLALLPLILAGLYKNGIKLYILNNVGIYGLLLPLIFDILGFSIGALVNIIYERIIKKNKDSLKDIIFSSFHPIYGLLISSIISINTNIFLFLLITFILLLLSKFIKESKVNIVALTTLIIILIMDLTGSFTFLNIYEISNKLNLNSLDYLIGRGSGGINTSHVLLLTISLLILFNKNYYKREIPIYSLIVYIICMIIYTIINNNIGSLLDNIFANGILFSFIFIATDPLSSPYTIKGRITYGIIIGLVTFGLFIIYPPLSSLGGIVIGSICSKTLDRVYDR